MGSKLRPKGRSADDDEASPQTTSSLAFHHEAIHRPSSPDSSLPVSGTTLSATFELTAAAATVAATVGAPFHASVVKIIDTTAWPNPSPDPAGLVWKPGVTPGTGTLLVSDSEVDETPFFKTTNLFAVRRNGIFDHSGSIENFCKEPTGIAYVASTQHLFISDDEKNRIFEVDSRNPGVLLKSFSTKAYAVDCEDIAYDPKTNHLLIVNGDNGGATNLHPHTIFETTTTGQLVRAIALPPTITDPEAITYDPARNVFYVAGAFSPDIFVVSRDGKTILDTITVLEGYDNPVGSTHVRPKALTLAPTSNPNDDPSVMSLWVADYGADQVMDGRLFEIKITNPLFSGTRDLVDFSQVVAGNYYGSQYDALAGNDTVMLAPNLTLASKAGFDPTHTFSGGDGNDIIFGRGLNDHVSGGNGNDFIRGGSGNDSLAGDANADVLRGGLGNDFLDGGSDRDTVDYQEALGPVSVNLALGTATGDGNDTLVNLENVVGSRFKDIIKGDALANLLNGYSSNDTLRGAQGDDTLAGGTGIDRLYGEAGNDTARWDSADWFNGGAGFDTLNADLLSGNTIDMRGARFSYLEQIRTGGGKDIVTLSLNDVLSDTVDDQFIANLGLGLDTLKIDTSGGWTATAPNATLGPTGVAAGASIAGMTAHTFTDGQHTVTVFTNAEHVQQILSS